MTSMGVGEISRAIIDEGDEQRLDPHFGTSGLGAVRKRVRAMVVDNFPGMLKIAGRQRWALQLCYLHLLLNISDPIEVTEQVKTLYENEGWKIVGDATFDADTSEDLHKLNVGSKSGPVSHLTGQLLAPT